MAGFRTQLDRLRHTDVSTRPTIADQLRFLSSGYNSAPRRSVSQASPLPPGRVIDTPSGAHYLVEEAWPENHFHGNVRLDRLHADSLSVLLDLAGLGRREIRRDGIVFLDTETTGVHGGAGMCPFLIGIGYYSGHEFEVRQYFIRDFDEEVSMLEALAAFIEPFDLIVTYNGRAFDAPLVENRCVLARLNRPFDHMAHFDLLFMARRLWKASQGSCRLMALEERVVRFDRGSDIPGSRIPQTYFDYVRRGETGLLGRVFSHNVFDILSLAALTIEAVDRVIREPAPLEDPRDVYSLARVFDRGLERSRSIRYYESALECSLPDRMRVRARERLAVLYRRTGRADESLACCLELIDEDEFSFVGYDGAALLYERRARDAGNADAADAACRILDEGMGRIRGRPGMERRLRRLEARRDRLEGKRIPPATPGTYDGFASGDVSTRS